ncbi:protein stum homolog [Centruroides sculpturatus]|uniref:protein stum homolog n=1 Tax=Centruroides sculpturatus TaxID=218467 RepID=UPI000C6DD3D8|nr:protein stum homolog [Centruroides sculpturatus]
MSVSKDKEQKSECRASDFASKEEKLIQSTLDNKPDKEDAVKKTENGTNPNQSATAGEQPVGSRNEREKQTTSKSTIIRTVVSAVPVVDHCDKPMSKYEIVTVRERHGFFRKAIPLMPVSLSVFLCILNVITPGIGTLIASVTVLCGCKTEHANRAKAFGYNLLAGLLQLITAPVVIGWVWSIMWGITFVNISTSKDLQECIVAAQV